MLQDSSQKCSAWKGLTKLLSKKTLGPKKNFKKEFWSETNLDSKEIFEKKNWGKLVLGPKIILEKNCGSKFF